MTCKRKRLASDKSVRESDFEPCIIDRSVHEVFVTTSTENSEKVNDVSPKAIKGLEKLRMAKPESTMEDYKDLKESQRIERIPSTFHDRDEYITKFQQALDMEYQYELMDSRTTAYPVSIKWNQDGTYFYTGTIELKKNPINKKMSLGSTIRVSYKTTEPLFRSTASPFEYENIKKWVLQGTINRIQRRKVVIRFTIPEKLIMVMEEEKKSEKEKNVEKEKFFWFMKNEDEFFINFCPNVTSHVRMTKAMSSLFSGESSCSKEIQSILLGTTRTSNPPTASRGLYKLNKLGTLNQYQTVASSIAVQKNLVLIQGPPGTGKTYTSVAIIERLLKSHSNNKIMVCAPSNAAVDHITRQLLKNGLPALRVMARTLYDREENIQGACLHDKLMEVMKNHHYQVTCEQLYKSRASLKDSKKAFLKKYLDPILNSMPNTLQTPKSKEEYIIQKLKQAPPYSSKRADSLYDKYNHNIYLTQGEKTYIQKLMKKLETKLIKQSPIICCTCVTAGSDCFKSFKFPIVLIDEASQSMEPATLVPIAHGCKKLILVGDDNQLAPVILSYKAKASQLDRSLFRRLHENNNVPLLLATQYRMHPVISKFPSETFYDGQLKDDESTNRNSSALFKWLNDKPILFWNSEGVERPGPGGSSYINEVEAMKVIDCIHYLYEKKVDANDIGVITPYAGQKNYLLDQVDDEIDDMPKNYLENIMIDSIDAFQGSEKRFIIFSCVRSNRRSGIGFIENYNRLNVAITRAKEGLIIIGHITTLNTSLLWNNLLYYYYQNGCLATGDNVEHLNRSSIVINLKKVYTKPGSQMEDNSDSDDDDQIERVSNRQYRNDA